MSRLRDIADQTIIDHASDPQREKVRFDTGDIIDQIIDKDRKWYMDTAEFAKEFTGERGLSKLHRFVYTEIEYREDKKGREAVKSPSALWHTGYGDCKSFSVFIGSVLSHLGIPYSYRFIVQKRGESYSHVYIVAHTHRGDITLDATPPAYYNNELPYHSKLDKYVGVRSAKVAGRYPQVGRWGIPTIPYRGIGYLVLAGTGYIWYRKYQKSKAA